METKFILPSFKIVGRLCLLASVWILYADKAAADVENVDYTEQIMHASLFSQPLIWVGTNPPEAGETYELYQAAGLDASRSGENVISALDNFVKIHANSPWSPSLEANLARFYRTQGRYSAALDYWQKAWQATKDLPDPQARMVADYTLAYWTQLLSSLGRVKELQELISATGERRLSTPEFQKQFDLARQAAAVMQGDPGISYRCGSLALYHVAQAMDLKMDFSPLLKLDSPVSGFSLSQLADLSEKYKLGLAVTKRPDGDQLVVPSVVHWKENHYAAIVAKRGGAYKVVDPTFGRSQWLSAKVINENASGYFMVPVKQMPAQWQPVSVDEAKKIFGKGLYNGWFIDPSYPPCPSGDPAESDSCQTCSQPRSPYPKPNPHPNPGPNPNPNPPLPPSGPHGCSTCSQNAVANNVGMPDWEVREPYISLWLHDRPMIYNMSFGRQFILQMDYHQRETRPSALGSYNVLNFGPDWNCNLLTYIKIQGTVTHDWEEEVDYDYNSGQWLTNVVLVSAGQIEATDYCPDGGEQTFVWDGTNVDNMMNPNTFIRFNPAITTNITGILHTGGLWYTNWENHYVSNTLVYANGSIATFGLVLTVSSFPEEKIALPTLVTDPQGRVMRYFYTNSSNRILLTQIVDFDGKTNLFLYGNATFPTAVTQITNLAYGLGVNFKYDANGFLTNITDVAGISSSFQYTNMEDVFFTGYDTNGQPFNGYEYDQYGNPTPVPATTNHVWLMASMNTPYGTTSFDYFHPTWPSFTGIGTNSIIDSVFNDINYAITVTQPDGGKNLFLYRDNSFLNSYVISDPRYHFCYGLNNDYDANCDIYNNQAFYLEQDHCNSFYWGPRQYDALSTTVLTNLVQRDFQAARLRVWLQDYSIDGGYLLPSQCLLAEQDFSPDVAQSNFGPATWYGYQGRKSAGYYPPISVSTNDWLPCSIGYQITDQYNSSMHLQNIDRNSLGRPVKIVDFGSDNSCNLLIRTNLYIYAANGIDLLRHIGPDGVVEEAYGYDGNHNVLSMTNALNEVTRYTYNGNGQVTSITQPNGLLTTNIYGTDGFLARQIVAGYSTNSYAYVNGLIYTHTDERGLTTTNTWDALQRLTKVSYPDGTSISYVYSNLDLVKVVDRLGFTTGYRYDNMQRRTAMTNALGCVTFYSYCTCGSLESIVDALGNTTYFSYDQAGQLTNTTYADGYSVNQTYNLIGLVANTTDSSGNSVNRYYDGFVRLTAMVNTVGGILTNFYDVNDLVTNTVDANGVSVDMTYDPLHRLLTRHYPDGGVERYGYAVNISGPVSYTNQIGNVMLYSYDTLNRKTREVTAGVTTNQFAYNGAGDLLALTDGKNQVTTWGYDQYGRVTNKVDAANNPVFAYRYDADNRLTNRWTPAKDNTAYSYDAMGNLTHISYHTSPAISLSYDALNRLTNLVDGVGTTVYGYDAAGQLLREDGPWAEDTVNYTYQHRLRTSMSVAAPNSSAWTQSYAYNSMRRLMGVTSPAGTFTYAYGWDGAHWHDWNNWQTGQWESELESNPGNRLMGLTLPNGAYITNRYDTVARLVSTELDNSGGWVYDPMIGWQYIPPAPLDSYTYAYNQANQRTNVTRLAGDYVSYTYDNAGELTSATGWNAAGTQVRLHERLTYAYDAAGNLVQRKGSLVASNQTLYSLNALNQITNAAVGAVSPLTGWGASIVVSGGVSAPATNVTLNGVNAVRYDDATFAANRSVTNGLNTFTAIAMDAYGRRDTNVSTVTVLQTNNAYAYDLNGNLLYDGQRAFAYDDENQLIRVTVTNSWKAEFAYDGKMRRRLAKAFVWNGSAWLQTNEVRYVYDGNLPVQERNANNLPTVTYTRGTDLSGTLQGAGGIGGLLARTDNSKQLLSDSLATAFYHADGNGNVTCLLYTNQTVAAKYLYDPFGNLLAMSGDLAAANTYRFSSKEWDDLTGLYYYLYRFYDPNLQRWVNRDPIEERGGINLYTYVRNNPISGIDPYGLWQWGWPPWGKPKPKPPGQPPQKPKEKCTDCDKQDNPAKDLFKTAADTLAGEVGGKAGGIVRLLLLAGDAKQGCGNMKEAGKTCGDFARQEARDPGYMGGQDDCEQCCHAILDSFPGLGGVSYFQCHAMCARF